MKSFLAIIVLFCSMASATVWNVKTDCAAAKFEETLHEADTAASQGAD